MGLKDALKRYGARVVKNIEEYEERNKAKDKSAGKSKKDRINEALDILERGYGTGTKSSGKEEKMEFHGFWEQGQAHAGSTTLPTQVVYGKKKGKKKKHRIEYEEVEIQAPRVPRKKVSLNTNYGSSLPESPYK